MPPPSCDSHCHTACHLNHIPETCKQYFWFKYDLGQKYYASQIRPDRSSNSWPPDHDSTLHVTEMPALTTRPLGTQIILSDMMSKRGRSLSLTFELLNDIWSQYRHSVSCMTIPFSYICLQITRSDIRPQVKRVASLVP